jgi:putative transposase
MTVGEIQGHLAELLARVSPDLISRVTDALDQVREWQNRQLDPVYLVVFFDAPRVKIRDEGLFKISVVCVAPALNPVGEKKSWAFGSNRAKAPNSGSR